MADRARGAGVCDSAHLPVLADGKVRPESLFLGLCTATPQPYSTSLALLLK